MRSMKYLALAVPALVIAALGFMYGGGLLNRGDYSASAGATADPASAFTDGRPNLVAAMFYSAWCGSCAVLEPKLRQVIPEFDGRAVQFSKFDFSMGQADSLMERAEELGVEDIYAANKGRTGFMSLIDRRTQREVGRIGMDMNAEQIRSELERAIGLASAPL